jgi:hypothetical protein
MKTDIRHISEALLRYGKKRTGGAALRRGHRGMSIENS